MRRVFYRHHPWLVMVLCGLFLTPLRPVRADFAPDVPEPGSVEKILEYTTDEKYLPESVSYVPESETVPSPTDFLGHIVGAPKELTRSDNVHAYFKALAEASSRVNVRVIGMSEEGREILSVEISAAKNLQDSKRYREITARLADPRKTSVDEMHRLAKNGKMIYYLLGGLHSPETGSPEMLMELGYRLAVSETDAIREIRDQVIVMITPVCEPDGRDRIVDWYYRHLRDRDLPYHELRKFRSPPYWGHYVYHDNNRDGMQLTLALTRAIHENFYEYHPQVVHDLHESLPLLYISTGHGPYSEAVDPVTINEWTQFAHHEAGALQAQGLPGVWTWGFWDGWWPGYLFSVANNHNSVGRFYETFGNSLAGTFERDLEERKFVGKPVTEEQWYRPWPPDKKVQWSLRNNTNYMQAGVLEALHFAALHREQFLRNSWTKAQRSMDRGRNEAPHAWIFPERQRDPNRLAYLVNLLQKHRYEVHRLRRTRSFGDKEYAEGSYVVRLDQPYRNAILNLLQEQKFPENEPNPPYDDVAWTWPLLFGVDGDAIEDAGVLEAPLEYVREEIVYRGGVVGTGAHYLVRDQGQLALLSARIQLGSRVKVSVAETPFEVESSSFPAGSWIVSGPEEKILEVAHDQGIDFLRSSSRPEVRTHELNLPKLGLLHTWTATQDCGWARYALDTAGVDYDLLSPDEVKRGRLSRYDVIVFPTTWGDFKRIVHGIDPAFGPLPYTTTNEFPSHGIPNASDDITGGMGFAGVANLEEFLHDGGVLLAMGNAGRLPVDGGMVRRVRTASVGRTPGSEITAKILQPAHPIAYGYEEFTSVFRGNLAAWDVADEDRHLVVMQFGSKQVETDSSANSSDEEAAETPRPLVLSGWIQEPANLDGKPAILDVPVGEGRVVLYSFNPLHRFLNHSDTRFLYNAIMNWDDFPSREASVQTVSRRH